MSVEELFQITPNSGYILEILIAEIVFCFYLPHRSHFYLRALCAVPFYLVLALIIPNAIAHFTAGFYSLVIFLLTLPFNFFCYDCSIKNLVFYCLGAQLAQNLSYNIEMLIYLPLKAHLSFWGFGLLAVGIEAVIYLFSFFVFVRRMKTEDGVKFSSPFLLVVEILACFFVYTIQWLYTVYNIGDFWVARIPLIFCCALALCLQSGLLVYRKKEQENVELERLIVEQGKQYRSAEESVALINMKAHDLKHYLRAARSTDSPQELAEIDDALSRYESTIQTGNKVVDVILTGKSYLCEKNHIAFHVMADEIDLTQVSANDLASMFGNALDNAIDYEKSLPEEKERYIGFRAQRKNDFLSLHFENFCPDTLIFKDGLPETTKSDKANHGFGLKSVGYVAKKYGGYVAVGLENSLFSLDIMLPAAAKPAETLAS